MQETDEIPENKLKKGIIVIIAIFLILLTLTYLLTNPTVRHVIAGLVESSKLEGNKLTSRDDIIITFTPEVLKRLNQLHNQNKEKEFKACLSGIIKGNEYKIDSIYEPIIFLQEYNQVISEPCNKETLVDLHSHPLQHCLPSEQDIKSFNKFKETNPKALMIIMCEENRFNIYS